MCNSYVPIQMKVEKILNENPDTSLRTYDLSFVNEEDRFDYLPGQFCEFSILGKGESPFGIASSPTEDGILKFTVNRTGSVTNEIHNLRVGDFVGIRGPMGNWYPIEKMKGKDVIIIGGGFAFTTLRSLLIYMLEHREDYGKITVLYGARNPDLFIYKDELKEWAKRDD
ncbi:MAG: FAD-binding oxidoreductase, partial [Candidatus Cloacimonadota bacterium]|nr:FAD-binding oxidoreductase [Candidatus Cloacimonadota bacterium]